MLADCTILKEPKVEVLAVEVSSIGRGLFFEPNSPLTNVIKGSDRNGWCVTTENLDRL